MVESKGVQILHKIHFVSEMCLCVKDTFWALFIFSASRDTFVFLPDVVIETKMLT